MSTFWKVVLGVGCGILFAVAAGAITCTAVVGSVGLERADRAEPQREAPEGVVVEDLFAERSGRSIAIRGKVRNTGSEPVSYVKVGVDLLDENGEVLDSAWTFAVRGTPLQPGAVASWEVTAPQDPRFSTYRAEVLPN